MPSVVRHELRTIVTLETLFAHVIFWLAGLSSLPTNLKVVVFLLVLEVWSSVLAHRTSRVTLRRVLRAAFRAPFETALGSTFIILPLLFATDATQPLMPVGLLTFGILLYGGTWISRYGEPLLKFAGHELRFGSRTHHIYSLFQLPWWSCNRPTLAASAIAIIGLLLICGDAGSLSIGVPMVLLVWIMAVAWNYRMPIGRERYPTERFRDSFPSPRYFLGYFVLPITALALIASVGAREITFFYGSLADGRELLNSLLQVEAAVGILAVTVLFIVIQIAAEALSLRIGSSTFKQDELTSAAALLVLTVLFTVALSARSPMFLSESVAESLWIDAALILALLTFGSLVVVLVRVPYRLTPEGVVRTLLSGMTPAWIEDVTREWSPRWHPGAIDLRDPMIGVERVLMSFLERRDTVSFRVACVQIHEALTNLVRQANVHAIDRYLAHHLRGVMAYALKNGEDQVLEDILGITYYWVTPDPQLLRKDLKFSNDQDVPGEQLIRQALELSVEHARTDVGSQALARIRDRGMGYVQLLPDISDCYWLQQSREIQDLELGEDERERRQENDNFIMGFEQAYLHYPSRKVVASIELGQTALTYSGVSTIGYVIAACMRQKKEPDFHRRIVYWGDFALLEIAEAAARTGVVDFLGLGLSETDEVIKALADDETELAEQHTAAMLKILSLLAKRGLLRLHDVMEFSFLGLALAGRFQKSLEDLVAGMAGAAEDIKAQPGFADSRDLKWTYGELVARIKQQDSVAMHEPVSAALSRLGEKQIWVRPEDDGEASPIGSPN